jgi:hypothetical protein
MQAENFLDRFTKISVSQENLSAVTHICYELLAVTQYLVFAQNVTIFCTCALSWFFCSPNVLRTVHFVNYINIPISPTEDGDRP